MKYLFFRIVNASYKKKEYVYLKLLESHREGGKIKHRQLVNLSESVQLQSDRAKPLFEELNKTLAFLKTINELAPPSYRYLKASYVMALENTFKIEQRCREQDFRDIMVRDWKRKHTKDYDENIFNDTIQKESLSRGESQDIICWLENLNLYVMDGKGFPLRLIHRHITEGEDIAKFLLKLRISDKKPDFFLGRACELLYNIFRLLAGVWWVFEVIPIGVTSIAIGVLQPLFMIRPAKDAMRDFMDPTVLFIFGSLLVGLTFTKVGLTKRLAYKMLLVVGENTRMILLGCFVVTALLTHIMAHTAVAATVIPIFLTILTLYNEDGGSFDKPNKFGKALFIGMAYTAGAGSICTLLGGARNPAAVGFFKEFTGQDISFIDFSLHMAPMGWLIVFLTWIMLMVIFKPEKSTIPGLRKRASELYKQLGPMSKEEIFVLIVVACGLGLLIMQAIVPALKGLDRSIPLLLAGLLFFATGILDVQDLEKKIPWNIVLLFSGAMSIGFALWQTGAAQWMAIKWLSLLQGAHWLFFVIGVSILVIIMTNFIMNVAAIAITLPVALVIAQYLGVNPQLILYCATAAAGLPMLLLIGAAPNAMAYESKQFSTGEFFAAGIPGTILVLVVMTIFIFTYWPLIGLTPLIK